MLRGKFQWLNKSAPVLVLLLIVVATSWSLITRGFFFTHDMLHLARAAEWWRTLAAGQFPPRWSQNFGFGYGIPLFEFYAPLPYAIGGLWYGLHIPDILNLKLFYLLPNLISVGGAYLLGKHFYGKKGGLCLAVIFGLAPYRAVDLFVRGAISESWGIMTFPWILYGISLVLKKATHGIWILLISAIVLFLSHNITTLLFMPLAAGFSLIDLLAQTVQTAKPVKLQNLGKSVATLIGTLVLASAASAFYVLPAFGEKQFVQIGFSIDDYYHYANHFLYLRQFIKPFWGYGNSVYGPNDTLSFFLGYGWWLAAGLASLAILSWLSYQVFKRQTLSPASRATLIRIFGWGGLSLVSLFMTLEKSSAIWALIAPLQFAQFPWRFLGCFAIFSCLTIVAGLSVIKSAALKTGVIVVICVVTLATQTAYFQPTTDKPEDATQYANSPTYIQNTLGPSLLEYLPLGVSPQIPVAQSRLVIASQGTVNLTHDQVGNYQADLSSPVNSQATWQVANFPGWQTKLDGQPISWTTTPQGLISLPIPAGNHQIQLIWGSTPLRFFSDLVSAMAGVVILAMVGHALLKTRRLSSGLKN